MVIGTSIVKSALCDRLALSASWFINQYGNSPIVAFKHLIWRLLM